MPQCRHDKIVCLNKDFADWSKQSYRAKHVRFHLLLIDQRSGNVFFKDVSIASISACSTT